METTKKEDIISHFTHPNHVLSLVDDQSTEYTCDLCKIPGKNRRFKCTTCPDFNLDPVCAICKEDTTSFMHPDHILVFQVNTLESTIRCSVCNHEIEGGHYICDDFHVHPVCTMFPEIIKAGMSEAHLDHELKGIFSSLPTTCHVCRVDCFGLRYRCNDGCDLDVHPTCLIGFSDRDGEEGDGSTRRGFWTKTFKVLERLSLILDLLEKINRLVNYQKKVMGVPEEVKSS